jgi:serine/threonine protein kinase
VNAPFPTQKTAGAEAVIADKYELLHILGRGSMGEVWLARHNTLFENVAIKLLAPWAWTGDDEDGTQAIARFRLEARIAAHLARKTRHIVQVMDHGEVGATPYIVMELLEGLTLETKLAQGDGLPLASVQELIRQVARALECAHAEGVLHRDLKPANVFLTRGEDGEMLVKVLDFGIARLMRGGGATGSFSADRDLIFGTPGYMSPEQAVGHPELDRRCDLWALATIAFEALTNELPVPGNTPSELFEAARKGRTVPLHQYRRDLPERLNAFFEQAFAKSPDDRFATVAELTCAFDAACAASGTLRPTSIGLNPGSPELSSAHAPRRRHGIAKGIAVALLATGLLGVTSHWRPAHGFRLTLSPVAPASPQAPANAAVAPVPRPVAIVEPTSEAATVEVADPTPPPTPAVRAAGEKHPRARRAPTGGGDIAPLAARGFTTDKPTAGPSAFAAMPVESSGTAPSCVPPYEADATGKKHWKLECL